MPKILTESEIEQVALDILKDLDYKILHGPDIAPDGTAPERKSYQDVVLAERLREAINKINPSMPEDAKDEAIKRVLRTESQNLVVNNEHFHNLLV